MTDLYMPNPLADAYNDLIDLAENCKDEELRQRYDDILIALAFEFHTIQEQKDGYSVYQHYRFSGYKSCGEYVAERKTSRGDVMCFPMLKYERLITQSVKQMDQKEENGK